MVSANRGATKVVSTTKFSINMVSPNMVFGNMISTNVILEMWFLLTRIEQPIAKKPVHVL